METLRNFWFGAKTAVDWMYHALGNKVPKWIVWIGCMMMIPLNLVLILILKVTNNQSAINEMCEEILEDEGVVL